MARIAVITIVSGRHSHLRAQQSSLSSGKRRPDIQIVVGMGDPQIRDVVATSPAELANRTFVLDIPLPENAHLPLARARNLGARLAGELGADLLIFLDVDCLASENLVARYESASQHPLEPRQRPALLCGAVAYLPPLAHGRSSYSRTDLLTAKPHTGRPDLPAGDIKAVDPRLFWSLSFTISHAEWNLTGGFDEEYVGYGGEDTDFAQSVTANGGSTWMVGGAMAYHQWHPVSDPPIEHAQDIVRNANLFHRRWGWFPMDEWLSAFRARGLADYDPQSRTWRIAPQVETPQPSESANRH